MKKIIWTVLIGFVLASMPVGGTAFAGQGHRKHSAVAKSEKHKKHHKQAKHKKAGKHAKASRHNRLKA